MIKFLQYLILFILVGNGLQPYLTESEVLVDTMAEVADESDCLLDEPSEEPTEEDNQSTSQDRVDSDSPKLLEPKPNDFEINPGPNQGDVADSQSVVVPQALDWTIDRTLKEAKIGSSLKQHLYFSKRAADDTVLA